MIRLFVASLRPKCVSTSLKSLPALCGSYRDLHTSGTDYDSEVENTPLLRTVRNRAFEHSNLLSEVSSGKYMSTRTPTECVDVSCPEEAPRKMMFHAPND